MLCNSAQQPVFTRIRRFCKSFSVHMVLAFLSIMMLAVFVNVTKSGNNNYGKISVLILLLIENSLKLNGYL